MQALSLKAGQIFVWSFHCSAISTNFQLGLSFILLIIEGTTIYIFGLGRAPV